MGGAPPGSMRWRKRVVRLRPDVDAPPGFVALELTCGHVVLRAYHGLAAYCEQCREIIKATKP